jgi:hypothetical protein
MFEQKESNPKPGWGSFSPRDRLRSGVSLSKYLEVFSGSLYFNIREIAKSELGKNYMPEIHTYALILLMNYDWCS